MLVPVEGRSSKILWWKKNNRGWDPQGGWTTPTVFSTVFALTTKLGACRVREHTTCNSSNSRSSPTETDFEMGGRLYVGELDLLELAKVIYTEVPV